MEIKELRIKLRKLFLANKKRRNTAPISRASRKIPSSTFSVAYRRKQLYKKRFNNSINYGSSFHQGIKNQTDVPDKPIKFKNRLRLHTILQEIRPLRYSSIVTGTRDGDDPLLTYEKKDRRKFEPNFVMNDLKYRAQSRHFDRSLASSLWSRSAEFLPHPISKQRGRLQRKQRYAAARELPYHIPFYNLLYRRWHAFREKDGSPKKRIWLPEYFLLWLDQLNYRRWKEHVFFDRQYEFRPIKFIDPIFAYLERTTGGIPIGYRRIRRMLQAGLKRHKFPLRRPIPSPVTRGARILAIQQPHVQRMYKPLFPLKSKIENRLETNVVSRYWQNRRALLTAYNKGTFEKISIWDNTLEVKDRLDKWERFESWRFLRDSLVPTKTNSTNISKQTRAALNPLQVSTAIRFITSKDRSAYLKDYKLHGEQPDFSDNIFSRVQHYWLHGFSRRAKKMNSVHVREFPRSAKKSRIVVLSKDLPRFPGVGRLKASYDNCIRSFYRRQSRLQVSQFQSVCPEASSDTSPYYARVRSAALYQRYKSQISSKHAELYLPKNWRRVTNIRKIIRQIGHNTTKRRFLASPRELIFDQIHAKKYLLNRAAPGIGTATFLLPFALKTRLHTRKFRDVKLYGRKRRLPEEQELPPWLAEKKQKARSDAEGIEEVPLGEHRPQLNVSWTPQAPSLLVPARSFAKEKLISSSGELLFLTKRVTRPAPYIPISGARPLPASEHQLPIDNFQELAGDQFVMESDNVPWKDVRRTISDTQYHYQTVDTKFTNRLVVPLDVTRLPSPLHFSKKTYIFALTEEEKKLQQIARHKQTLKNYKFVHQLTTVFTSILTQIVHLIVAKKTNHTSLKESDVRKLVRGVYWGVRLYIHYDPFGVREDARDTDRRYLRTIKQELAIINDTYFFDEQQLHNIRNLLQPHELVRRPSLASGAINWVRVFFPKFYDLFVEDPDKYLRVTLPYLRTLRAHPSRKNPGKWETRALTGSMEKRFRGLSVHSTHPVETLLVRTKRPAILVGYGFAAQSQVTTQHNRSATKHSFFCRTLHTFSALASKPLIFDRLTQIQRQTATGYEDPTDSYMVTQRYAIKSRAYMKGSSNQLSDPWETGIGALDPRRYRHKSPRNLQLLHRSKHTTMSKIIKWKSYTASLTSTNIQETMPAYRAGRQTTSQLYLRPKFSVEDIQQNFRKNVYAQHATLFLQSCIKQHSGVFKGSDQSLFQLHNASKRTKVLTHTRRQLLPKYALTGTWNFSQQNQLNLENAKPLWARALKKPATGRQKNYVWKQRVLPKHLKIRKSEILPHQSKIAWCKKIERQVPDFLKNKKFISLKNVKEQRERLLARKHKSRSKRRSLKSVLIGPRAFFKQQQLQLENRRLLLARRAVYSVKAKNSLYLLEKQVTNPRKNYVREQQPLFGYSRARKPRTLTLRSNIALHKEDKQQVSNILAHNRYLTLDNAGDRGRKTVWLHVTALWAKRLRIIKNWLKVASRRLKKTQWSLMPNNAFRASRSRLRKLVWREPNARFSEKNWRAAFSFHPNERRQAPWLEKIMYRRSLYTTKVGQYNRYQLPREQKRLKWVQKIRKILYGREKNYLKNKKLPQLRTYNQRLFLGAFDFRNKRAAQKHFQKLNRRRPAENGWARALSGCGNRLDVTLMLLNLAPTIRWARILAKQGLLQINKKTVRDPNYRLQGGDRIYFNFRTIERMQQHFSTGFKKFRLFSVQNIFANIPKNFEYHQKICTAVYTRLPTLEDLPKHGRIHPLLFKLFQAESVTGR